MNLFDSALAALLPIVPKAIVGRIARRYVAGDALVDAMRVTKQLNDRGCMVTLDVLGEEIEDLAQADKTRDDYLDCLDAIQEGGFDANVSIKLTGFGLRLDPKRCRENVEMVLIRAKEYGNFVRIDMEDSSTTTDTLELYRDLREAGYENVGVVLQAYMRRTLDDIRKWSDLVPSYRICKGIYKEPDEIAFQGGAEVNDNYMDALTAMFDGGCYVGIATHDKVLVDRAEDLIADRDLSRDSYEFQMLLGVTEELGRKVIDDGHRLRIYIPFGPDWYAYCLRRLRENPKIGRYVFLAMFRRS